MSGMADQYPEEMDVDWASFASRAKTILLDRGIRHHYYDVLYEDELVEIVFLRKYDDRSLLQVTRKAMPDHHKEQLRRVSNPVYMEVLGECIRTHGEGRYIYKHMIDLSQRVI